MGSAAMRDLVDEVGIQIGTKNLADSSTPGAWLMGCAWSEIKVRLGVLKHDIAYQALSSETYTAMPITWPAATD